MIHAFRIAWIAIRELLYERVFYLLLCFSILSLCLSLLLGQLTYAEQAKLTLDFMLAGMQISMTLFSVFMGISLFQRELTSGSVSMVLSKPISRSTFLLGKYLGQVAVQCLVIFAMACVTLAVSARFGQVAFLSIFQTVILIVLEISILTAVTYFFAVNAGAITTAVVTLCIFGIGHLRSSVGKNLGDSSPNWIWQFTKGLVPDLEVFNMKALASYGFSISWAEMGWAWLYALCCIIFYLLLAMICFDRKDILT